MLLLMMLPLLTVSNTELFTIHLLGSSTVPTNRGVPEELSTSMNKKGLQTCQHKQGHICTGDQLSLEALTWDATPYPCLTQEPHRWHQRTCCKHESCIVEGKCMC
jgi:hypothetical protein